MGVLSVAPMQAVAAPVVEDSEPAFSDWFHHGEFEAALTSGALFSPLFVRTKRRTLYYTQSALQVGYMVSDTRLSGLLRGNFEFAGELFGGAVFRDDGSYISGGTFWFRRNFVHDHWRLVPYAQVGAGLTFTDADRILVGQTFNFNLDAGIGARYFLTRNVSVNLEYRFQHISNADQARHNLGINGQGGMLGISLFF